MKPAKRYEDVDERDLREVVVECGLKHFTLGVRPRDDFGNYRVGRVRRFLTRRGYFGTNVTRVRVAPVVGMFE